MSKTPTNFSGDVNVNGLTQPKVYKANFTQSGANPPVMSVEGNSIGEIVWTRSSAGAYVGTLNGAFPDGKTHLKVTPVAQENQGSAFVYLFIDRANNNQIDLTCVLASNGNPIELNLDVPQALYLEIEVYK